MSDFRLPADSYDDIPHGIWESVFLTRDGGRPYRDGRYATQCKVCRVEYPDHASDCAHLVLETELRNVLNVAIARGEALGYTHDNDYRQRLAAIDDREETT